MPLKVLSEAFCSTEVRVKKELMEFCTSPGKYIELPTEEHTKTGVYLRMVEGFGADG